MKTKKMHCNQVQQKLIFYVEKELSQRENDFVVSHLDTCSHCASLADELSAILAVIEKDKEVRMNPYFLTRVEQRLASLRQPVEMTPAVRLLRWVPVAASIILAIWAGVKLGGTFTATQVPTQQVTENIYPEDVFQDNLYAESIESVLMINGDNK